jgi:hypothetical protein
LKEENVPLPDFDIRTNNVTNEVFVTISDNVDILRIIDSSINWWTEECLGKKPDWYC